MKENLAELLKKLEIQHRFSPKNEPVSIIIQPKDSIRKFKKEIGFMKGIEVSPRGFWGGFEKSKVLEIIVKSFELPRGKLQEFTSESEI